MSSEVRLFFFINSYLRGISTGVLLFFGLVLTFSRGPLYSSIFAALILGLGYTRHRLLYLMNITLVFVFIGILSFQLIDYYSQIDRSIASSTLENTAIYRVNLIQAYMEYIQEKFWLGWGSITWPKATNMASIDNEYLYILVIHGFAALVLLCSILLVVMIKLFYIGMKIPNKYKLNRSLAFTLLSIVLMLNITYLTVYMAHQVEVLTFIIVGLSQGFLDTSPTKQPYFVANTKKGRYTQTLAPA